MNAPKIGAGMATLSCALLAAAAPSFATPLNQEAAPVVPDTDDALVAADSQAVGRLSTHLQQAVESVRPLLLYDERGLLLRQVGAFRISDDGLVTSAATLSGCARAAWELGPGRSIDVVGVSAIDRELGVAQLKLNLNADDIDLPPILTPQPRVLRSGPMIGALGISLTMTPIDKVGRLTDIIALPGIGRLGQADEMQTPGLEGGPVFSQDGALVGVLGQKVDGDRRIVVPIKCVLEAKPYNPTLPLHEAMPPRDESIEHGRMLVLTGKSTAAVAALANHGGARAAFWRGLAQGATNQYDAAVHSLEQAAESLHSTRAHLALAKHYELNEQSGAALRVLRKAQARAPESPAPRYAIAQLLQAIGRDTEALQSLKQTLNRDPAHVEAMAMRGLILVKRRRLSEARPYFDQALSIDPYSSDALVGRGRLLLAEGKPEESLASFRSALRVDPDLPGGHLMLANALNGLEQHDEALAAASKALEVAPTNAEAHLTLGKVLVAMDRHEESLEHLEAATVLDPEGIEGYLVLGQAFKHLRKFQEALVPLNKALAQDPRNPTALFNIGFCYLRLGERGKARDNYKVLQHIDGRAARLLFRMIYDK